MKSKKINVGQLLMDSLTGDQIACLLEVVASAGDMKSYMDDFKNADPDMAATVDNILKAGRAKAGGRNSARLASDQRTIEYWDSLWRLWHEIVAEVGNEEGKYAVQDHHWEEPYFGGSYFAVDLEPIAQDMLGLIDDVYNLVDAPDLFFEALDDIEGNISSYPEWMGAEYGDPCMLEQNATVCVLKWLWLSLQHKPHAGIALLEKVFEIEESYELLYLNQDACVEFFIKLPDIACREIYTYLKNEEYAIDLSDIYSPWHRINHDYESRFDSAKYLETCRRYLSSNWRYGRPLIDDALDRKEIQEAELVLVTTFASFLERKKRGSWYPETSLLIGQQVYYRKEDREKIAGLLQIWSDVSLKLDNSKRRAAAELQGVIFRLPEDCDAVINVYKRLLSPKIKKTIDPLFNHWKTKMAERSFPRYMDSPIFSDTWIHWTIDALLNPKDKKQWFLIKLNGWLNELKKNEKIFIKQWPWLARLTTDLPDSKSLKQKYPVFYETTLPDEAETDDLLGNFRCNGLKKMKAGSCQKIAMKIWQTHLRRIVPDPANAYKSDYTYHAQWAKALYELNQEAYTALLVRWRKKHNRRRNLWRDMKAAGLSV